MNQRLFLNAFNIKELAYQQCSFHVFALALVYVWWGGFWGGCVLSWGCFKLISECPHLPEGSGSWWVCKLGGWMGKMWRTTGDRKGKAHPTHFLLLNSAFSALFRFHHCLLRARLNMDFFKAHHIIPTNKDPRRSQAAQLQARIPSV